MSEFQRILRVFLASPGDLNDERAGVHNAVNEVNSTTAEYLGYQVKLLGWETTPPGYGRPQTHINPDVDQCDLFIGMISKKWGTPPTLSGEFTSGFEEEFERAKKRRQESESPEIALFFKRIPSELMDDPGGDLKKVLKFKERIEEEKELLFKEFDTPRDIEMWARMCVNKFVFRIHDRDNSSDPEKQRQTIVVSESDKDKHETTFPENPKESFESVSFLRTLVEKIAHSDRLDVMTPMEVARFRLLANSISKPGNQERDLGVHDINLLFSMCLGGMTISEHEKTFLLELGAQHINNENVPVWYWFTAHPDPCLHLVILSCNPYVNDSKRIGAIRVLSRLKPKLMTASGQNLREIAIDSWFSEPSSTRLKVAALRYLGRAGNAGDYAVAEKEYNTNNHETSRAALECMIRICLKTGQENSAAKLVLQTQFQSLDSVILQTTLAKLEDLETAELRQGLNHQHAQVRVKSLKMLLARGELDRKGIEPLLRDGDASMRYTVVKALEKFGKSYSEDEVKKIIVQPTHRPTLFSRSIVPSPHSNKEAEILFTQHQMDSLKRYSDQSLTGKVESSLLYVNPAYFARAEKYFAKYADELRRNIDDTFYSYCSEVTRRINSSKENLSFGSDFANTKQQFEDVTRKLLTREALNILCKSGKREDLDRIRSHLQSRYVPASMADADYLGKHGGWTDILLLANAESPPIGGLLSLTPEYQDFKDAVPKAILRMASGHSVSNLFALEIPTSFLAMIIKLCPRSKFSRISDDVLYKLLLHELADVRKAASIKAALSFPVKRIKLVLQEYVGKRHYYNVIHWLDLGASMSRDEARRIARSFR